MRNTGRCPGPLRSEKPFQCATAWRPARPPVAALLTSPSVAQPFSVESCATPVDFTTVAQRKRPVSAQRSGRRRPLSGAEPHRWLTSPLSSRSMCYSFFSLAAVPSHLLFSLRSFTRPRLPHGLRIALRRSSDPFSRPAPVTTWYYFPPKIAISPIADSGPTSCTFHPGGLHFPCES